MKVAVESANAAYTDFCSEEKLKVLHVDNDAAFLAVAKQCLEEQSQLQVDTASSAEEAIEKLRNSEYDAIIADYQMSGKNGLELLKEVRQEGNNIPFFLFTCKGKEDIAIEALNSGAEQYIYKQDNAEATYEELKRGICNAVKKRRTEKRLSESENLLRQITENMQDMLLLTDTNLVCTYASASHKWILGYEPSEMVGKTIYDFVHSDDLAKAMKAAEKAFKDNSGGKMEVRVRRADGNYILAEGIGKLLTDENGQVTGVMLTSRDITERKKIEEKLRASEKHFRETLDNMMEGCQIVGHDWRYLYVNDAVVKHGRTTKEELLGKTMMEIYPGIEKTAMFSTLKRCMQKRVSALLENEFEFPDGKKGWFELRVQPVPEGIFILSVDITERKEAEQALSKSEEKYRRLFEEALDAIFIADAETGILIDCNHAATKLVGRPKSELIGMYQRFLHPPEESQGEFSRTFRQHLADKEGQIIESQVITKNGEIRDVTIKANLIEVNGRKMLRGVFRDITESRKSLEKVRFQARLLNAVGQAVIATDIEGNITYWNRAAEQVYGWSEAEVLGRNIVDVTPAETSKEQATNILNRLIAGESWSGEFIAKRRDGTFFPAIVTDAPIINDEGEFIGIIGVSTDITEQKWMQEVFNGAIGKVVELNEKLRVVENLTRHDIRNKLSALNSQVYLLKKRVGENQEALPHVRDIELLSQQMLKILEFEKIYVQVGAEELKHIVVEKYLIEAVSLFSDLKGARLINECHGLTVLADSLLRQLFYNLIDNSLKYGEKLSRIRVHYEKEENQLKLIYEDDGVGMPEEMKSNLFNEGFGKGTGYGLYLIKRISEAYGWTIQETGKQSQGVQFTMIIPKNSKDGERNYEVR
jgi:PAS domain S-box-containing protein